MSSSLIFESTTRPDAAVFFHRNEPGDPRLGEAVLSEPSEFASADVVLLGCPQDEGVRRNGGRPGAAHAPDAIRAMLYRLVAPANAIRLFDLGNTRILGTLEATHDLQQQLVHAALAQGKRVISLGGGNDLSYPDCAALASLAPDLAAFNIDAHLDVRQSPIRHSGTPYRMLLDEGHVRADRFFELGHQQQVTAIAHLDYLARNGAYVRSLPAWREAGLENTVHHLLEPLPAASAVFWGIDMDVVCAADAPGVSAPNPAGLAARELCALAALAGADPRSRVFEITEVNPSFDIDNRTARLAAFAIHSFLAKL